MKFESQPEHSGNSFLRKKFKQLPVFFPRDYRASNTLGIVREYKLNAAQRIFMTFKDQRGSKLGMIIRTVTKLAIIVNAFAYIWSWSPTNMKQDNNCDKPTCADDPDLCPNSVICEPRLDVRLLYIQFGCMFVLFTNWTLPLLFCWSVPARLAGVLDLSSEIEAFYDMQDNDKESDDYMTMGRNRTSSTASVDGAKRSGVFKKRISGQKDFSMNNTTLKEIEKTEDPKYSFIKQFLLYITTGRSIRAIVGTVPLLVVFLTVNDFKGNGLLLYIARMTPLVLLVDFISGKKSGQVTRRTLARAYPTMLFMIWCIFLLAIVVGAVVFLLERGNFTVTEEFPSGAYLRPTVTGRGKEESPFTSMALSLYWVVVTITSVGYGELVCTSAWGRLISCMLMILSIFVLALPIAVIGQILTEEMDNYVERKAQKETRVAQQIGVDKTGTHLLHKYNTTIERRKSQFSFDLPHELKQETDRRAVARRQTQLMKIKSANNVLHSRGNGDYEYTSKLGSRDDDQSSDQSERDDDDNGEGAHLGGKMNSSSSALKLFDKFPRDDSFSSPENEADLSSPVSPTRSTSPTAQKKTKKKRPEVRWDEAEEKINIDSSLRTAPSIVSNPNRRNPMLRSPVGPRTKSEPFVMKEPSNENGGQAPARRVLSRSSSSTIRDIDRELKALETAYLKKMQQCTELHNQIVELLKVKNESLNEALL